MQTKLLIYIVIGVLVVAGIAGASLYFTTKQPAPLPEEVPSEEPYIKELYIKVISPNGGERWTAGKTYNITWEPSGLEGKKVNIYLLAYSENKMTIAPKEEYRYNGNYLITENISVTQEKFIWTIPAGLSQRFAHPPSYYKINISSSEELFSWGVKVENLKLAQSKEYFEIPPPEEKEQSITVISPNGGEEWVIGKTYDIAWQSSGITKVDIRLANYGPTPETIPIKTDLPASSGKYSWTLSQVEGGYEAYPGDKFKIEILDSSNYDRFDQSDSFFSIVK